MRYDREGHFSRITYYLRQRGDARYRMNLHPLFVIHILNVASYDAHMRSHRRNPNCVVIRWGTRWNGVCLRYGEFADDLEHQIPALIADVSRIQEILEFGVNV